MNRVRKSIVWRVSDESFKDLVKNSRTMSELLKHFGLENKGGNFHTCKKRIVELNIDSSHFLSRIDSTNLTRKMTLKKLKENLCQNSNFNRYHLKKYLIKFELLKYECSNCENNGEWDNKPLSLQLEHKNGIFNDNRLDNLCFLCPNCHSQTSTFAGKKLKISRPPKISVIDPNWRRRPVLKNRKVERPPREILEKEILEFPFTVLGKKYGVRDNSIRKWCKAYNIQTPYKRGYWQKLKQITN